MTDLTLVLFNDTPIPEKDLTPEYLEYLEALIEAGKREKHGAAT